MNNSIAKSHRLPESLNSKLFTPDQRNETEEDDQVERTKHEIRQFSGVHTYNPYANSTLR